ncbi:metallopeptidase family M24 protein [Rutstroemia sp. NJR-2017a BBW]|nr:metallopeptidase family M24 protein [Rutstroemia sp. NJR-2017a BBW]
MTDWVLPPPPNPSSDAGLSARRFSNDPGHSPPSPNSLDVFTLTPVTALKLLCAGIEALVQITGDIPPTPPTAMTPMPNMKGMQEEKEKIRRSGSFTNLAGYRQQPSAQDVVDGVNLRQRPMETHINRPAEPYIIVGENAEPLNVQHSAITRKFYSKQPPPISLEDYLMRIHKFCPMSTAVYLATSSYIHRVAVDERVIPVTRRNSHRLILAGLRVAMKALEDQSYAHARFAKVGGVSEQELSRLEINFCFLTNFEFKTSKEALLQHAINLREVSSLQGSVNFVPRMDLFTSTLRPRRISSEVRYFLCAKPIDCSASTRYYANTSHKFALHDYKMAAGQDILSGKYPAKQHAKRVVEYLKSKHPDATGVLYLESQKTTMIEDNDEAAPFRQRRFFYYLTGCPLPDSYFTYDIASEKSTLFIPPIDADSVIWSGLPTSPEEALSLYDVDAVLTTDVINAHLAEPNRTKVWAIAPQISTHITFLEFPEKDFILLKEAIEECRVQKDEYEVELIRKANAISTIAHTAVLKNVKSAKNERELEGLFIKECIANGAREQAYHSIVASGEAAATLHYMKNSEGLEGKLNLLLDAGGEYNCYASDITRTFPISGSFTSESLSIYNIVLKMQLQCIDMLKAGVQWEDVHILAHKIAIEGLLELGILKGDAEEILKARTSVAFFPHGLGHYLGMDTHDTGGHPNYDDEDRIFRYLRVRGQLPEGSVVTVEPGVYFCRFIIEPYLKDPAHSKYIDADVLEKYWPVGGVRIEDNILITKDGYDNLTTTVKDVDEMLKIINSA